MKINYRPEIDGLRALAVIAVILYHAQITLFGYQPFKGGFIGVDIFFVISGYLITSIILKELVSTGNFSFKNFYERRIRRILPALLFVMLASLFFAWKYLLPGSFIDFSKSILYSLGFSSNFYFHFSGLEYNSEDGLLKPFLHTWSLSVEEQYYIIFPIIFLITFKYFKKYIPHILILGLFISLGLADWGSRNYPSFNFYALPTRGWELIAGSLLAYFEINQGKRSQNQILNQILPVLGLFLIIHSIIFFNDSMFHPSLYTISPIIGVCLIIWFTNKEDDLITQILSFKPIVAIGLVSYSLYMWHYPIFAFARIKETMQTQYDKFELIVLTLILSIISFYLIEKPARNKNKSFKFLISFIIAAILIITTFSLFVIKTNGVQKRIPEIIKKNIKVQMEWNVLKDEKGNLCYDRIRGCIFNKKHNNNIILVGDSHAGSISNELKKKAIENNYGFVTSLKKGCNFILNLNRVKKNKLRSEIKCDEKMQNQRLEFINEFDSSIVVLLGRLPLVLEEDRFNNLEGAYEGEMFDFLQNKDNSLNTKEERQSAIFDNYRFTVQKLIDNGHKIILVYPIPEVGWHVPYKLFNSMSKNNLSNIKSHLELKNFITTSYQVYKDRTNSSFKLLDSIKSENVYKVYPHKLFCDTLIKGRCITHDNKDIFYADDDHPSLKGSQMINNLIFKEVKKIY